MKTTRIETERLMMREFQETDLEDFFEVIAQEEVYQWLGDRRKKSREEAEDILRYFIGESKKPGTMILAVIQKETNQLIGQAGIKYLKPIEGMEYFYALHQDAWNQGFATEMGRAVTGHYKKEFPDETLSAVVYPENQRSKKVLRKLGFQQKGHKEAFGAVLEYYQLPWICHPSEDMLFCTKMTEDGIHGQREGFAVLD